MMPTPPPIPVSRQLLEDLNLDPRVQRAYQETGQIVIVDYPKEVSA